MFEYLNNNKLYIIAFLLSLVIVILGFYIHFNKVNMIENVQEVEFFSEKEEKELLVVETTEITEEYFYVDLKGCVNNPGVYRMNEGTIVNDLLEISGGIYENADLKNVNLSKKLENEMVIYIYCLLEEKVEETTNIADDIYIDEHVYNKESIITDENNFYESEGDVTSSVININTSSKDELMTLSGIGESKAQAIIDYRENKRFENIEEIQNVSGIGVSTFEKIKDYITTK